MKKLSFAIMTSLFILVFIPTQLSAVMGITPVPLETTPPSSEIASALNARLLEIREVDKSSLSKIEKKALRKEARVIKNELRSLNNGIYLSGGAIILVVLLLILLL